MHRPRSSLSAGEIDALHERLARQLDRIGIETQPEVAARLLELATDPEAGMGDFADAIRHDVAITGRLLRMVNSAFYAQREPVTRIDRACVLLGLQRLRAVALGFYLSRAAATDSAQVISRRVWGQSVFRACLAFELVNQTDPAIAAEAFVCGLMVDAGIPLAYQLLGEPYERLFNECPQPATFARREADEFPYTHVDLITCLAQRWKLPELLAKPLAWHHIRPACSDRSDPVSVLQRAAYFVGILAIDPDADAPVGEAPMPSTAEAVLGIGRDGLARAAAAATEQYAGTITMFDDIAETVRDTGSLAQRAHLQLVRVIDDTLASEAAAGPAVQRFTLSGRVVEVELGQTGVVMGYLCDERGARLCSATFDLDDISATRLAYALGLDGPNHDEQLDFDGFFGRRHAA